MATPLRALEAWAALAELEPRQHVFCPIDVQGRFSPKRLSGYSASVIVQKRMRRGRAQETTPRRPPRYSRGSSMRAGCPTNAAAKKLPSTHTRHKSADMVTATSAKPSSGTSRD